MRLCIFTIIALCLVAACSSADEEYEYEDEPAAPVAPVTPAPSRSASRLALLSPRGRGPVGRKPAPAPSTTAKPVEQVVEEEEGAEELEGENLEDEAEVTTTTEAPKKVRGGVRPFRSNEDLLAALKRRRAQAGSSNSIRETASTDATEATSTARPKSISSNNSRSRGSSSDTTKSGRGRFGATRTAVPKPVQEEVDEETQQEEVEAKPKSYRRG